MNFLAEFFKVNFIKFTLKNSNRRSAKAVLKKQKIRHNGQKFIKFK